MSILNEKYADGVDERVISQFCVLDKATKNNLTVRPECADWIANCIGPFIPPSTYFKLSSLSEPVKFVRDMKGVIDRINRLMPFRAHPITPTGIDGLRLPPMPGFHNQLTNIEVGHIDITKHTIAIKFSVVSEYYDQRWQVSVCVKRPDFYTITYSYKPYEPVK
jgi:hypothetical protein